MPTKDSGKPAPRKRTSGAGKGAQSTGPSRGARKRAAPAGERPTPAPTPSAATTPSASAPPGPRAPRRGTSRRAGASPTEESAPSAALEPVAEALREQQPQGAAEPITTGAAADSVAEPLAEQPIVAAEQAATGAAAAEFGESSPAEEAEEEGEEREPAIPLGEELPGEDSPRRRERRGAGTNALGVFIERHFANPTSPAHSYSDLERHSGISREALSRYVTARADRRRSPTIDTLVAIADALHVSLEAVARAAGASVRGVIPPSEDVLHAREETLGSLVAALSDEQFNAVVELLRQMRPPVG